MNLSPFSPPTLRSLRASLFVALFFVISICLADAETVKISIDRTKPLLVSKYQHGVTHTQRSLDSFGNKAAVETGKALLRGTKFQNQHIMGWGALNPEPSPGVYDWKSLDARLALIRSMNATPIITLCGAPDWMKGGEAGKTDWSKLESAPKPEHYADFAKLAGEIAKRYPDVKYFQVWNEMKGLWNASENNWNYSGYTELYNLVYDSLKAVNHDIQVGGPYLVVEGTGSMKSPGEASAKPISKRNWKVIDYWLANKHGAEFITLDRGIVSFHDKNTYTPEELMALTPTFASVTQQIRAKTELPVWWAEYYGHSPKPLDRQFSAAMYASIWKHLIEGGASVALLWEPQGAGGAMSGGGLFSDTQKEGGGTPYPMDAVYEAIGKHFSSGAKIFASSSTSPEVEALATPGKVLLINKSKRELDVICDDQTVKLPAYAVRLLETRN